MFWFICTRCCRGHQWQETYSNGPFPFGFGAWSDFRACPSLHGENPNNWWEHVLLLDIRWWYASFQQVNMAVFPGDLLRHITNTWSRAADRHLEQQEDRLLDRFGRLIRNVVAFRFCSTRSHPQPREPRSWGPLPSVWFLAEASGWAIWPGSALQTPPQVAFLSSWRI